MRHQIFQVPLDRDNNCFFCQVPEFTGISGITPGHNIGRHLYLQLHDTFKQLDEASRRLCPANLTELRLVYQFNLPAFVRATVGRLDLKRNLDLYLEPQTAPSQELFTQFLFSYKLNPQTVVFVGYSNTDAGTESIPVETTNPTAFVKLGYAWLL